MVLLLPHIPPRAAGAA